MIIDFHKTPSHITVSLGEDDTTVSSVMKARLAHTHTHPEQSTVQDMSKDCREDPIFANETKYAYTDIKLKALFLV